jgi:hypothetical protein
VAIASLTAQRAAGGFKAAIERRDKTHKQSGEET